MLRLPPFRYERPRRLEEVIAALREHGPRAMLMAGGTDLVPNLKRRQFEPEVVVSLRGVEELRQRRHGTDGSATLGAGLTLHELAQDEELASSHGALVEACAQVANPQIQRMGTLGGNLCVDTRCNYYNQTHEWRRSIGFCMKKDGDICLVAPGSRKCWAISSSDTAPVLMALGARVELAGAEGRRTIPVAALYRDDGIDYLTRRPDEVLTRVQLPAADGVRSTYRKVRRRGSFDFPILGVAAVLALDGDVVRDARLVLGAVHTHPVEVPEAAEILNGERFTEERAEAVAAAAQRRATPLDNADLTLYWRKKVARVEVRRALRRLTGHDAGVAQ